MSSKNALLVVVSLLCLGGLGWLVYDQTRASTGPADLERAGPAAAGSAAERDAELSAGAAASDAGAVPAALRAQAAPEVDASAKKPAATERSGTKVIGRVVDESGRPLPGADVQVSNAMNGEFFNRLRENGTAPRRVTTDSAGRFEWIGAKPGSNTVSVRADGYAPLEKDAQIPIDAVHDVGELRVALGAVLSGRVVDDAGRGVAGAKLHLVESDFDLAFPTPDALGGGPLATCEADGSFRVSSFACGPWKIRVHSEDHPDRLFEGNADRPGFEVSGLRFELAPGTTIEGVALGVPADQSGKVKVRAQSIDEQRAGFGFGLGLRSREAEVGPDGRFRIRGLGVDQRWQLQLRSATAGPSGGFDFFRQRARSASLRASSGDRGVQLRWQQDSGIALQVVDAKTRAPLEAFEVTAGQGWRMEPLRAADGKTQKLFPDGRVRVGDLYPNAENGGAKIEIRAPGYADWKREDIALLAEADVNLGVIELEPTPTLVVTVLDAATQAPVADARVSLRPARKGGEDGEMRMSISIGGTGDDVDIDDGSETRRARTDEKGIATLSSFPGQTCTLRVESEGRAPFAQEDLQLPEDARHEQTVRLSAGGSVAIHVTDKGGRPISGLRIEHRRSSERGPPMPFGAANRAGLVTNSEGLAFATNLESGKHRFRVAEAGGGGMRMGRAAFISTTVGGEEEDGWSEVEVLEGQEAKLELQTVARASLTGTVREAGLALAGASVNLEEDTGDNDMRGMGGFARGMRFGGMGGNGDARTSGQGEYLIEGRKPGKYKLVVEHALRAMPESFPIELREGENRLDVELLLTTIEGRIVDPQGKPIAGVRVRAEEHRPESGRNRMIFAFAMDDGEGETVTVGDGSAAPPSTTDADGHYLLRGVAAGKQLVVRAETKDWQPARSEPVEVAPGENKQGVDLVLERGGKLEIEALDAADKPVRMAFVTATPAGGGEPKTGVVGPGGVCTLTGLKPGSYSVTTRRMGPPGGGNGQNPEAQNAVVAAGESAKLTFRFE